MDKQEMIKKSLYTIADHNDLYANKKIAIENLVEALFGDDSQSEGQPGSGHGAIDNGATPVVAGQPLAEIAGEWDNFRYEDTINILKAAGIKPSAIDVILAKPYTVVLPEMDIPFSNLGGYAKNETLLVFDKYCYEGEHKKHPIRFCPFYLKEATHCSIYNEKVYSYGRCDACKDLETGYPGGISLIGRK